jgi:hypothetical protein
MFESDAERPSKPRDRKLGDEWADWKGDNNRDSEINEALSTFSTLAAAVLFIMIALLPVIWYLIKPRIEQLSPHLSNIMEWSLICFVIVFVIIAFLEAIWVVIFKRSLFPYRLIEKVILYILPKAVWLGSKFGISRDRVGNSFIKVHNFITKSYAAKVSSERLLILLPRCLKKEARSDIIDRTNSEEVKVLTVAGGEEAREAIKQYRPTFILALACERDLMSGIKDVAEKVPVLAIPNKRPEGPCKNTDFSLSELEEALLFIRGRKTGEGGHA